MEASQALLAIAAADIRPSIVGETDLLRRVEKAFAKAQHFWMSTDDDVRMRGALAAVLLETPDEAEKRRITVSLDSLRAIAALLSGVPVDVDAALNKAEGVEVIPLMSLWQKAKAA